MYVHSSALFVTVVVCLEPDTSVDNGNVEVIMPYNTSFESGYYLVNTTIMVSCDKGYVGGGRITCKKDGNWTSSIRMCSRSK